MLVCLTDDGFTGLASVEQVLKTICFNIFSEVKRLQEHPDLFPSQKTRESFEGWIECESRRYSIAVTSQEAKSKMVSAYLEGLEKLNERTYRPNFKPNLKPWHQFLHNGSPGIASGTFKPKIGSSQVVPPGGVHLTGLWRAENRVMLAKRNAVRSNPSILLRQCLLLFTTHQLLLTAALPATDTESNKVDFAQGLNNQKSNQWKLAHVTICQYGGPEIEHG